MGWGWLRFVPTRTHDSPPSKTWTQIVVEPVPTRPTVQKNAKNPASSRVVDTKQAERTKDPVNTSYLGAQNQKVREETQARKAGLIREQASENKTQQREAALQATKMKNPTENAITPAKKLSGLGLAILPKTHRSAQDPAESNPDRPALVTPQGAMGGGEYIKGLKEGEFSALNTREFVFYSYFQRIRERLDRAWVPILRAHLTKMYKSGRTLASDMDHHTKILVHLTTDGEITRVQVISESGTRDLDDAAVKAFNKAGPFPNPPKGLIGTAKEIKIPWEFILRT
jgi:TonB family protein